MNLNVLFSGIFFFGSNVLNYLSQAAKILFIRKEQDDNGIRKLSSANPA